MTPSLFMIIFMLTFTSMTHAVDVTNESKAAVDEFIVFKDSTHIYNYQDVLSIPDTSWSKITQNSINFGYEKASVWLKFTLHNPLSTQLSKLLDINYPLLDSIELYEYQTNTITPVLISGDSKPFKERTFKHPNFVTPITLNPRETKHYLLKIQSNAPIQTQILVWEAGEFQYFYRTKASLTFLYLGILLSTALFNLVVYLFIKENTFLAYGLYATSFALLMTTQDVILFEYVFPDFPALHNWSQLFLGASTLSLTCVFNLLFLKINNQRSRQYFYLLSSVPALIFLSSLILGYAQAIQLLVLSILFIVPACFILGIIYSKDNENRIFYLIAWGWLFLGVSVFALSKLGVIPYNLFTNYSIQLGSTLELLTFAVAMAKRLHTEKETRIQAQQLIINSTRQSAKLQKELLYNATHNDITGLPNRNLFSEELNKLCKKQEHLNVILVRLSRIAELDKTLGRDISNYVLEQISSTLNAYLQNIHNAHCLNNKESFYAANLSNSTFAFILTGESEQKINHALQQIQLTINKPIRINELNIDPWITIGFSTHPEHGNHAQLLLRNAGIALDNTVSTHNKIYGYHKELDTYNERRLILINELKEAISNNKMQLLYQPLIDTQSQKIIGAEALIRWPHAEYGTILPSEFIEIAEQTGIIQALSLWVFKQALFQLKQWHKTQPDFLMSVNISAQNIRDSKFIEAIELMINKDLYLAKNMVLEVTESQMMEDTQYTLENLWKLNELGFNIAIDDFGTGYSNLSYLKKLPANELKIDKAFILNLESDKQNQILVQTAIQMAHNLGLKVVAEGVESKHTRELLARMNCDMCQGFHFSRPLTVEHFNKLFC